MGPGGILNKGFNSFNRQHQEQQEQGIGMRSPQSTCPPILQETWTEPHSPAYMMPTPRAPQDTAARSVPASEFFLSYRTVDLKPHEILAKVGLPLAWA